MWVLPRLFKLWRWVDLDLFYVKVKFGYIGYHMGESDNYLFFGNCCSLRSQSCLMHSAKWVNEVEWVSKVKVILWPWSKVTQISKLNVWLWPIYSGERFRASWPSCFYHEFHLWDYENWQKYTFSIPNNLHNMWSLLNHPFRQVTVFTQYIGKRIM